jgi:hypothetical protein
MNGKSLTGNLAVVKGFFDGVDGGFYSNLDIMG